MRLHALPSSAVHQAGLELTFTPTERAASTLAHRPGLRALSAIDSFASLLSSESALGEPSLQEYDPAPASENTQGTFQAALFLPPAVHLLPLAAAFAAREQAPPELYFSPEKTQSTAWCLPAATHPEPQVLLEGSFLGQPPAGELFMSSRQSTGNGCFLSSLNQQPPSDVGSVEAFPEFSLWRTLSGQPGAEPATPLPVAKTIVHDAGALTSPRALAREPDALADGDSSVGFRSDAAGGPERPSSEVAEHATNAGLSLECPPALSFSQRDFSPSLRDTERTDFPRQRSTETFAPGPVGHRDLDKTRPAGFGIQGREHSTSPAGQSGPSTSLVEAHPRPVAGLKSAFSLRLQQQVQEAPPVFEQAVATHRPVLLDQPELECDRRLRAAEGSRNIRSELPKMVSPAIPLEQAVESPSPAGASVRAVQAGAACEQGSSTVDREGLSSLPLKRPTLGAGPEVARLVAGPELALSALASVTHPVLATSNAVADRRQSPNAAGLDAFPTSSETNTSALPVRQIRLGIPLESAQVELHFREVRGEVQLEVSAADALTRATLRNSLPELIRNLDHRGLSAAEVFPRDLHESQTFPGKENTDTRSGFSWNSNSGSGNRHAEDGRQTKQNRPSNPTENRWMEKSSWQERLKP